ncbi:MAG TPA: hypothetical protein VK034_24510, partial [Enhygromyxa sp.]|nr:hypothetical protein [Enhygromyxa sp.]
MSGPIATLDPARPKISDELWKQSGTPLTGWLIRGWIALVLIAAGWILADVTGTVYPWALVAVGIAAFVAAPALVESLVLARLAAKVDAIERERNADRGHAVLDELRNNATVKMLAPHGWLRVQEGRIHLAVGDGRAAARAFAEAERVSTHPDKHALISAQAHALVLSGDRKEARELLGKLRKADQLSDLDHLNFGVVLLSEAGHNQEALAHLKQAREAFGDHPRALAGLMLALQRCDKTDESAALLGEAEAAVEASADQLAQDLLKRAKKGLRPLLKAKQKRERKTEKQVEPSEAGSSDKPHKPKGKKGRKQARRDARKKAKAEARHGTEPAATEASDEQATLDEGSKDVEAHDERDEAAEHERDDTVDHDDDASDDQTDHDDDASDDQPEREVNAQPVEVAPEPAAAGKRPASEDDGIDLASLALEALGSGSRRKLDESEGGP